MFKRAIKNWHEIRDKLILIVALKIGHQQVVGSVREEQVKDLPWYEEEKFAIYRKSKKALTWRITFILA